MGDRTTAIALYNQGVSAINDRSNPDYLKHAYQLFSSACLADPTYHHAFYQAGNNNSDLGLHDAAIACWRLALGCSPPSEDEAKIKTNLGWRLFGRGELDEAMELSQVAAELDPKLVYAWVNLSLMHGINDQDVTSIECARKAFALDPNDPTVEMGLAFALLHGRRLREGFKHFESRFRYKLKSYLQLPYPKWEGESGKTLYLDADQGLGDTISFARFVEAASQRCKYIHMGVQSELLRLFTHAFVHLPNVNILPKPHPFPQADYWSTFVSLPSALGLSDEEIRNQPHIQTPNILQPVNWLIPDRKLHIGIAWAGSPLNDIDKHRNIPLKQFLELYKVPGVQLYSLQVGERSKELYDIGCLSLIRDLTPYIRDVVDTLGLLTKLDLVITAESALGHICALAGKQCIIPYSHLGRDYRIGHRGDDMLWTPNHIVVRQDTDMSWNYPFEKICFLLEAKLANKLSSAA